MPYTKKLCESDVNFITSQASNPNKKTAITLEQETGIPKRVIEAIWTTGEKITSEKLITIQKNNKHVKANGEYSLWTLNSLVEKYGLTPARIRTIWYRFLKNPDFKPASMLKQKLDKGDDKKLLEIFRNERRVDFDVDLTHKIFEGKSAVEPLARELGASNEAVSKRLKVLRKNKYFTS